MIDLEEDAHFMLMELFHDRVMGLIEAINIQVSEGFTEKINKMYKDNDLRDDNGELVQIRTPRNLPARVVWNDDNMQLKLTIEEERWFRADQIHGRNLLESYGFKALLIGG